MSPPTLELKPTQRPQEIEPALEIGNAGQATELSDPLPRSYTLDYLKPFKGELLEAIDLVDELYNFESLIGACRSYMKEQGDKDAALHSDRTAIATAILAKRMGLPEAEIRLGVIAAACHDVGRSTPEIRPTVKSNLDFRKLSSEERNRYMQIIDLHTKIGADMIRAYTRGREDGEEIAQIVDAHHAPTNDRPHGMIPQGHKAITEALALVDELDALASTRSYKPPKSETDTRQILEAQFAGDPRLIELCFDYRSAVPRSLNSVS